MLVTICVGISLSACCGLRVFLPLLAANLAAKFGYLEVGAGFEWLYDTDATVLLTVASIVEIIGFYFIFIDHLLDAIAIPASAIAGTLISTSVIPLGDFPALQWGLGIIAGGGVAGSIQTGTSLIRLASTKFTLGTGNFFFATFENVLAILVIILTFVIAPIIAIIIIYFVVKILRKKFATDRYSKFTNFSNENDLL